VLYCDLCGAANDVLSRQCHRCGGALEPDDASVAVAIAAPAGQHATQQSGDAAALEIGTALDLPNWLKPAAALTPESSTAGPPPTPVPPAGFHVAGVESSTTPAQAAPLPSLPTAGLPEAIPDWLKAQPFDALSSPASAALVEPQTPQSTQQVPRRPTAHDAEAANIATFISETDLPDWIRQIAVADAAKRAEEAARKADGDVEKRVVLPDDQAAPMTVANPWLSRQDASILSQAWDSPATAPMPTPVADLPDVTYEPGAADVGAEPANETQSKRDFALRAPKRSSGRLSGLNLRGSPGDSNFRRSTYLIGGIILLLTVLYLML
jgi:hypothetical protein